MGCLGSRKLFCFVNIAQLKVGRDVEFPLEEALSKKTEMQLDLIRSHLDLNRKGRNVIMPALSGVV